MHCILFGNPAILTIKDPWFCVTGLLRFCLFGDICLSCSARQQLTGWMFLTEATACLPKKNAHSVAEMSIFLALKA